MSSLSFTRTRIAPTPSGYLHAGNAMSFLITAALAGKANAKLLLRLDDLDKERIRKDYVEDVFDTLRFLGIEWNEGPKDYEEYVRLYSQLHRMKLYEEALQQLRDESLLFACRCSRTQMLNGEECNCREENIPLDSHQVNWRLITDGALLLRVRTMDGNLLSSQLPPAMKSFVVRKKDGMPSYQLTSLVDDEYFRVDAIVRGEDLWDSTLAQQYLSLLLRKPFFANVVFCHHPLVKDENGKLSKSAGATSVRYLRSEGKTRDEVLGMIEAMSRQVSGNGLPTPDQRNWI